MIPESVQEVLQNSDYRLVKRTVEWLDLYADRYCTEEEALAVHDRAVQWAQKELRKDDTISKGL